MFKVNNINSVLIYVNCMTIFSNIHVLEKAQTCPYLVTLMYQEEFTSLTTAMSAIFSSVT
jgi:hypothetical protein